MESRFKKPEVKGAKSNKKPINPIVKQVFLGLLIFLVIGGLLFGFKKVTEIDSLQIKYIEASDGPTIDKVEIEQLVKRQIEGRYLSLFPKTFTWMYPRTDIAESLEKKTRIKSFSITKTDKQSLRILFEEYTPFALWCQFDNHEVCYFVDSSGFAFAEAPVLTGNTLLRFYNLENDPDLKKTFSETGLVADIVEFTNKLKVDLGFYTDSVSVIGTYDVDVALVSGGVLKLSQHRDWQNSFADLKIILNDDEFAHLAPGNFQYIDLRFGDKVFVNEESAASEEETASSSSESNEN